MLFYLKRSLPRQIIFLLLLAVLSWLGAAFFDVHPRLRATPENFLKGLLGGVLTAVLTSFLHLVLSLVPRLGHKDALKELGAELKEKSSFTLAGAALTASVGEELLFRGVLFGAASRLNLDIALAGNFLVMLLLYVHHKRQTGIAAVKAIECTLYAYMFSYSRSLCMVGTAHFVCEVLGVIMLRWERLERLLSKGLTVKTIKRRILA